MDCECILYLFFNLKLLQWSFFEFLTVTVNYKFRIPLQKQGDGAPVRRLNITGILNGVEQEP